ncbi:hypothetical protein GBC03_06170 [Citrobacter telavivensis]|uniref:Uncharacterized protein n=1 Tax=Citrobacter telavivensis TaxID=2653932 RepID=A0A6L5EJ54_9ENTR|nr:hypothetical protein [Citrobacter telavivensis]QFS69823.1 hypothetical protein GBC03_06170 [Citrobacter telavivensis]
MSSASHFFNVSPSAVALSRAKSFFLVSPCLHHNPRYKAPNCLINRQQRGPLLKINHPDLSSRDYNCIHSFLICRATLLISLCTSFQDLHFLDKLK